MNTQILPEQLAEVHSIGLRLAQQYVPKVQKHFGHSDPKDTEFLLNLIVLTFEGGEEGEVLEKFVSDLLQDVPEALAVEKSVAEFLQRSKSLNKIYEKALLNLEVSFEWSEPSKEELSSLLDFYDSADRRQMLKQSVLESPEYIKARGRVAIAQDEQIELLKMWADIHWLNHIYPPTLTPKKRRKLPLSLPGLTFAEVKAGTLAISDGRDRRNWSPIEGALALLHKPKSAAHQVRFEPNNILVTWWGKPPANADSLWGELEKMDMDSVMLYHVVLANILFDPKARFTASIDEMIKAIGREGEAKRNAEKRAEWRHKVWRALLLFDSLAIIGARSGTWKEPQNQEGKRVKMAEEKLISRDPLFRIIGTRETEQGSFDKSEPPKEVSLVPGEWLMRFHGNREILSDLGDVLKIAAIPRGKAAGNWAACIGLMLNQLWRERAAKATRKRAGDKETLDFGAFTRRQLLEKTLRSDCDVSLLLQDQKGRGERVREYWKTAIQELKNVDIIGHYSEGEEPAHEDWRERWLDQWLDIRPKSAMPQALEINENAAKARKRTPRKKAPKLEVASDDSNVE